MKLTAPAPTIAIAIALLALSGCKQEGKQAKATGGTAAGEILPGSTSDAMIPVDTLRSQPPLAPHSDGAAKPRGTAAAAEPSDTAASPPATEAPPAAAEPAPPAG